MPNHKQMKPHYNMVVCVQWHYWPTFKRRGRVNLGIENAIRELINERKEHNYNEYYNSMMSIVIYILILGI